MAEKILAAEEIASAPRERVVPNGKNVKRKWTPQSVAALCLALIPLVGFIIFSGFPLVISLIALFCDVDLNDLGSISWNGFAGFKALFVNGWADKTFPMGGLGMAWYFGRSCLITLWVASTQFVTLLIALGISVLLASRPKGQKVFQALFFVPYICSTVAISIVFAWIFKGDATGVLNTLLNKTPETAVRWLEDPSTITWCIVIVTIWQAPGYGIVMYKAALVNVDPAQYEAASLDGANAWQKFRYVTLPGIRPTTFYLMLTGVSAGLLTYDIAKLLVPLESWGTIGGEGGMAFTLMRYVYYCINMQPTSISNAPYLVSCASVISWILFFVTAACSIVLFRLREKSMED